MDTTKLTTRIALWASRIAALAVVTVGVFIRNILEWYEGFRILGDGRRGLVTVCYYLAAAVILLALFQMDRLLSAILCGKVFIRSNVRRIRIVQWCCAAVAAICLVATFGYMPLIFATCIMAFLALTVCVVTKVMDAAVSIREENDLTV